MNGSQEVLSFAGTYAEKILSFLLIRMKLKSLLGTEYFERVGAIQSAGKLHGSRMSGTVTACGYDSKRGSLEDEEHDSSFIELVKIVNSD